MFMAYTLQAYGDHPRICEGDGQRIGRHDELLATLGKIYIIIVKKL